ncbi:MAG: CRTAC1 family protein, partial [bacterium]|nr:CRTAC1 family protein [bacterium]
DGYPDIVFAALSGESFPLFRNDGGAMFTDVTHASRLGPLSYNRSGWSPGLFDFNNDGWKDLFTTNSHVNDTVEAFEATKYRLRNTVFANRGDRTFDGGEFGLARAHRGCGFADFNNDGRMDVVVASLGEPVELWENITPGANGWLALKLIGAKSNRDGIGARIRIGDQHNHATTTVGYNSSSHGAVHFGLGGAAKASRIEIRWPSGAEQVLEDVSVNQVLTVKEP